MDECMKSLVLKCNRLLEDQNNSLQNWEGISQDIETIQGFDQREFVLLSGKTLWLRELLRVLLKVLNSSESVVCGIKPRVLSLLLSFCSSDAVRTLLIITNDYRIVPTAVSLLQTSKGQSVIICLQLLETLSYGMKDFTCVHGKECEVLIKYCASVVLSGAYSSPQLLLSLEIIINICTSNTSTQTWLKVLPNYDSFQQKIVSFLTEKNISFIVTALHLLAILHLNDSFGSKIFKSSNMNQMLQLTLSIICTSFDYNTIKQAVDLLVVLLSSPDFQHSLAQYPQFEDCIQKGFKRLGEVDGYIAEKLLELYMSLISSITELSFAIQKLLFNKATKSAFRNLLEMLQEEEITYANAVITGMKFLYLLIKLPNSLAMLDDLNGAEKILISAVLKCFIAIDSDCRIGHEKLLTIKFQKQKQALLILSDLKCSSEELAEVNTALMEALQYQLQHNPSISQKGSDMCTWSDIGISVGINCLLFLASSPQSGTVKTKFNSLLKDSRVLFLMSCAMSGKNKSDIYSALSAVCQCSNSHFQLIENLSEVHAFSNEMYNEPMLYTSCVNDQSLIGSRECLDSKQLEELIDKFKSSVEIKDVRASEIMSVYEHKLQNMLSKETHLQDLLDTKSKAMVQADRLLKQYRLKMTSYDTECHKLRNLLQVIEEERETLKDKILHSKHVEEDLSMKINQCEAENIQLRCIVEKYHELKAVHCKETQRLDDVTKELNKVETQNQELQGQVTILEAHKTELQEQLTKKNKEVRMMSTQYETLLHNLQTEYEGVKHQLHHKELQEKEITNKKVQLEQQLKEVTQLLHTAQKDIQVLSQKTRDLQENIIRLEKEVSVMGDREQTLKQRVNTLQMDADLFSAVKSLINKGQSDHESAT